MKEERYFFVPQASSRTELPTEEAAHAVRVLRLKTGDEMVLMDGEGSFYRAEVTLATNKHCAYKIKESLPQERKWRGHIHIVMAPTKMMERVEWFVEKATEIGVDEFSFLLCRFSDRKVMRIDRIEKVVVAAVKQSRKAWMPIVNDMIPFKDFIRQPRPGRKFIAHCYNEIERPDLFEIISKEDVKSTEEDITILIGPEGDFSIDEVRLAIDNGYESISLGTSRLRTETAALSAAMMSQLCKRI